jgi:hypothetical protein
MGKKQAIAIRTQLRNVNRHTPRGMSELERSISQRGWIGAPTVAADGESFDGSARLETGAGLGFDYADPAIIDAPDDRPIIVRSRGQYPVIHMRADIPTADDDRAKLLALEANKIAADNLSFDPLILAELSTGTRSVRSVQRVRSWRRSLPIRRKSNWKKMRLSW